MNFTGALNYASAEENAPPQMGIATTIADARPLFGKTTVDDAYGLLLNDRGFLLADAPSAVVDWTDPKEVAGKYYDEALGLARALLRDFKFSPISSHTFRSEDITEHHWIDGIQYGPCAEFVHNDYADTLSPDRQSVERTFPEIMGMPTDKRVVGINIWRSVTVTPLERFPLAVCDRTSIDPEDLVYSLNVNAPKPFNAHYCLPNAGQRWYYYSGMRSDEALVFTTYDSQPDDGQLFRPTLHTAVALPGSENRLPRVSVEVRFFGFLDTD